jgi:hypothetical protein
MHKEPNAVPEADERQTPILTIPKCKTPPRIDGVLSPGEWDEAAGGSGLAEAGTHRLLRVQPRFQLCYDDKALYFAASVPACEGAKLAAAHKERSPAVSEDDSIELFLDPRRTKRRFFQFVVNSLGTLYAAESGNPSWDGEGVRAAASVRGREWVVELAVPFAALGTDAPTDGAQWGLNVCMNYPSMASLISSWGRSHHGFIKTSWDGYGTLDFPAGSWGQVGKSVAESEHFGHVIFASAGPVVQVEGIERLQSGKNELSLKLAGGGAATAALRVWPKGDAAKLLVDVQKPVSARWTLPFDVPLPAAGQAPLLYQGEVKVQRDNAPLLFLPFVVETHELAEIHPRAYVESDRLEVEVYPGPALLSPEEYSASVTISPTGGKPVKTVKLPCLKLGEPATAVFQGKDIPGKSVTLSATVLDKAGKAILEWTRDLDDPLHPWWLDDKTGAEDVILPPYQLLQTDGKVVRPWGRVYGFGGCLLPSQVDTAGVSVLAGPILLKAVAGGRHLEWAADAPRVVENTGSRVTLTGAGECSAFRLSGTALIECDGMIRVDLDLAPTGAPMVDELTLEIPVKSEHAKYLYYFPTNWIPGTMIPPEERAANAGDLPADGFKSAFKNFLWLGDDDRGFAWFCESKRDWLPGERKDAITVEREAGRVVLRLHLIKGQTVSQPLKYTFGLQATPVKAPDKTVWDYRLLHAGSYDEMLRAGPFKMDSRISYPAWRNIRAERGTAEMWFVPPFDSNPDNAVTAGAPESGDESKYSLIWLDVDPQGDCGLCWHERQQELRLWSRADGNELVSLGVPVRWKKGEWHHVAFSWGDELKLYVDGMLVGSKPFKGLTPKDVRNAALHVGKSEAESPCAVDELRVSSIERAPRLNAQPYAPDADTLLLDHFDQDFQSFRRARSQPVVAAGGAGIFEACAASGPGRHGLGVVLRPEHRQDYSAIDQLADYGVRTLSFHMGWSLMCSGYPLPATGRDQDLRDLVKACHRRGIQLLLYASPLTLDESPEWELYQKYFLVSPTTWPYIPGPGRVAVACCWAGKLRNMWLARQARLIEEYDVDGFYLDGSEWPVDCANREHGCGHAIGQDARAATCNIFGTREYMKRLFVACRSRKSDAQINVHNSTCMVIPTLGWGTSSWDGEQWGTMPIEGNDVERKESVLKALRLDAFRAEFMGRQWGVPSELLCYENQNTSTPQLLTISLLHNVLVRPHGAKRFLALIAAIWRLHDDFGMKEAAWYPYWSNGDIFRTNAESVKVSAYRHPRNGLLMLLSNLSAKPSRVQVRFDHRKLGLPADGLKACDAISDIAIDLENDTASFEMAPFSYRYVRVG